MHNCAFGGAGWWVVCGKSYNLSAGVVFLNDLGSKSRLVLTRLSATFRHSFRRAWLGLEPVVGHFSYLSIAPTTLITKFN